MAKPTVISTLISSRETTQRLCNYRSAEVGLSLEGFRLGTEKGEITLIYIIDPTKKVYVFDVYKNPGLVHEGGLADLLRCTNVTKVVHNCQSTCSMLYWRHGIIVRNVFDVQVAHGVVNKKLKEARSAREDNFSDLCQPCGISIVKLQPDTISSDKLQPVAISSDKLQLDAISSDKIQPDIFSSDKFPPSGQHRSDIISLLGSQHGRTLSSQCQSGGILTNQRGYPVTLKDQIPSSGLGTDRSASSGSTSRSPVDSASRDQSPRCIPSGDKLSREVTLRSLKDICEIEGVKFNPNWIIKHNGESSKFFWRTRPLTDVMLEYLVETVSVLPTLCSSLKRNLCEESLQTIQEISQRRILSKVGKLVPESLH